MGLFLGGPRVIAVKHNCPQIRDKLERITKLVDGGWQDDVVNQMTKARNLVRSRIGRAFVAIRDNDLAAEVMGVNIFYYKLLAFFISCFYAGVAGSLSGHLNMIVHPDEFTLLKAIEYIGMMIVGGLGSIPGVFF